MSNLTLTVPKDRVRFEGEFAIVDTGMSEKDFVLAMLQYVGSDKDTMAFVKKDGGE